MNAVMNCTVPQLSLSLSYGASARILVTAYPIGPSRSHSDTPHSAGVLWPSVIIPTQWPLPDNAQRPQKTDSHATGGIQTHNPSEWAATDHYEVHSVMPFFVDRGSSVTDVCLCCMCWKVMINRSTVAGDTSINAACFQNAGLSRCTLSDTSFRKCWIITVADIRLYATRCCIYGVVGI